MRLLLALTLTLLPSAAFALSCIPPNAGRELNIASEKGQIRHVVVGTLIRETRPAQRKGYADVTIGYRLDGMRIEPGGQTEYTARISYQSNCVASWCGPVPQNGTRGLFLARPRGKLAPLIVTGPCGGGHYPVPDAAKIKALAACLAAKGCRQRELEVLGRLR